MSTAAPLIAPERVDDPAQDVRDERDRPWNVIVWDDPVTLMTYVVFVLRKLFGHDEPTASRLMLQIHHEGKAIVASGPREKSEISVGTAESKPATSSKAARRYAMSAVAHRARSSICRARGTPAASTTVTTSCAVAVMPESSR